MTPPNANMDTAKHQFLQEFGDSYGYPNAPNNIDHIRATQFKRLDGSVYLDHAGATLYSELQMEAIFKDLSTTVYGNPHSQSNSSLATSDIIEDARHQVLKLCNASPKEYKCIFTSGATAALKLVGEAFPWSDHSTFMYTIENHNSVLGIREYALNKGAAALAIDFKEAAESSVIKVSHHPIQKRSEATVLDKQPTGEIYNLFAFPSECNFSGVRFNLDLINIVKEDSEKVLDGSQHCRGNWMVLLDAAKGCSTDPPDLSTYKADFVVISFYKLFGYPTGLGALLARNEAAKLLKKSYFSGGTVAASIADIDFVKRREGIEESFEDGTLSFLSIAAIRHGFDILNTLTPLSISRHTSSLARYTRNTLLALRHANGQEACVIYGLECLKAAYSGLGPIVSFNLKRADGSWVGPREVEKLASLSGIQLRTGCFCNPGACSKYLGLSHADLLSNIEAGHVCWDDLDILHGKPTGAVRVSFGYMSTFEDAWRFMNFIVTSFVLLPSSTLKSRSIQSTNEGGKTTPERYLTSIVVYPIKSCAGFKVDSWPLSSTGLLYDREWLLKSMNGEILTQKKAPEMNFIATKIDLKTGILYVESPRCKEKLLIELKSNLSAAVEEINVHAQRYEVIGYDNKIDTWFSNAVGRPCYLLRSSSRSCTRLNRNQNPSICRDIKTRLNFVNEAQLLLISEESVSDLNQRLNSKEESVESPMEVDAMRFRPNLVISGGAPYVEDSWSGLKIGKHHFTSLGGCNRCQMINLNYRAGEVERSNEPLATLAAYRRTKGKILFGILLRYERDNETEEETSWVHVGQEIYPDA
ncbi:putative molybdenum cofactor sulfurtransferase [Helianthus annuus]|uniref:Molybdenum cofactor sulfurase n=1 Tax=Helianthus annuus TaxID=4232 RepID=A0A251T9K6_HELAN|nr:molybdenum cofactor sulfurase [Helianthus annuus]KAF5781412.1 putative molybdenum cofactor sulfurtransferase [Helianthus annuus]KAJ0508701.1 putative molybdenum cofactor sulfurtransferase [Helianthus annuus]